MTADRTLPEALLEIEAVLLRPEDPFQWSSGLWAPVYCDNRLTMSYPDVRRQIADEFSRLVRENNWQPDTVVGTATAGIPHAAWLAERLDAPMAYVRGRAKQHGRKNKVEGRVHPGDRVVVVEDLISTGGSVLDVVQTLREHDARIAGVVAIFSYGFPTAEQRFERAEVDCIPLTSFDALVSAGQRHGKISREAVNTLRRWHDDPQRWSESFEPGADITK